MRKYKKVAGEYPAAFLATPDLYPWLTWHYNAWSELGRSRLTDQGYPRPLSVTAIRDYCEFFDIPWPEVREELFFVCGVLDDLHIEWACTKKEEQESFIRAKKKAISEDTDGGC